METVGSGFKLRSPTAGSTIHWCWVVKLDKFPKWSNKSLYFMGCCGLTLMKCWAQCCAGMCSINCSCCYFNEGIHMAAYKLSFEDWVSGPIFMSKNGGAFEARTIPSTDTEVWISSPYLRTHQILAWVLRFGKDRWTVRLIRNEGDCIHHLMLFKAFWIYEISSSQPIRYYLLLL